MGQLHVSCRDVRNGKVSALMVTGYQTAMQSGRAFMSVTCNHAVCHDQGFFFFFINKETATVTCLTPQPGRQLVLGGAMTKSVGTFDFSLESMR